MERRVGPLPLWGWVVVAIAAYLVWRRRTEAGYFPTASFEVSASSGTGGGSRSFLGLPGAPSEPSEEEPSGSALFLGGGGSRPTLPPPITAGGPDGSAPSGGGGEVTVATSSTSNVIPLFGVAGAYDYSGTTSRFPRSQQRIEALKEKRSGIGERIQALREGGVTAAEAQHVDTLRGRKQRITANIQRIRAHAR